MANIIVTPTGAGGTGALGTAAASTTIPITGAVITVTTTENSPTVTVTHVNHGCVTVTVGL